MNGKEGNSSVLIRQASPDYGIYFLKENHACLPAGALA
jgi:hypothetical protein